MFFRKFLLTAIILFLINPISVLAAELKESRAIFDETFEWETPEGARRTLDRIKRAGFNVYIPRVWLGDGVFWHTELAPKSHKWKYMPEPDYDPLAYLIKEAHSRGIEVHPWFTVMNRWREFFPEYYDEGTPKHAFNVHIPEFRVFIVNLMLDVVKKYDVDGINLDFIRSRGLCVSKHCVTDYKARFNRDVLKDVKVYKETDHFKVEKKKEWTYLMNWNRIAVTDIVKNFSLKSKVIKPNLIISVATIVLIEDFRVQGADALEWANNGWVDVIYHMDYYKKIHTRVFNNGKKQLKNPDAITFLVGNVDWPDDDLNRGLEAFSRDSQMTAKVLNDARVHGNGVAMWTYKFLTDEQIEKIRSGPFKDVATPYWGRN